MKINLDPKDIKTRLKPVVVFIRRYLKLIFAVVVIAIYGFLIIRIGLLNQIEPTKQQIEDTLKNVKRPTIDKNAVIKIQELQDQNVDVQALFKAARDNPFSE